MTLSDEEVDDIEMWWELALNPKVVLAYYTSPPELIGVEINSVYLHRDGPTLELLVDMPRFPDKPSKRWDTGANCVLAGLRFFDLREVSLAGWSTSNVGDLNIYASDGVVRFQFECATARLSGSAGFFDVKDIKGLIVSID